MQKLSLSRRSLFFTGGAVALSQVVPAAGASPIGVARSVRDFGAKGDGKNDDSAALQSAIDAALAEKSNVYLPNGRYVVTRPIEVNGDSVSLVGESFGGVVIVQKSRTPILVLNSFYTTVENLWLKYEQLQSVDEGECVGILIYYFNFGTIRNIRIENACDGIKVAKTLPGKRWKSWQAQRTGNVSFSSVYENLIIWPYSGVGADLSALHGGTSGNLVNNIYLANKRYEDGQRGRCIGGLNLGTWTGGVLNQVNIEHMKADFLVSLNHSRGVAMSGLHVENIELAKPSAGIFRVGENVSFHLGATTVEWSWFLRENCGPEACLFDISASESLPSRVSADLIHLHGNVATVDRLYGFGGRSACGSGKIHGITISGPSGMSAETEACRERYVEQKC